MRTMLSAILLVIAVSTSGCTCTCMPPPKDMGGDLAKTIDLGKPADLSVPSDLTTPPDFASAPDLLCHVPCFSDGSCPAAIWGVCVDNCCVCRPPDGGICPVFVAREPKPISI